MTMTKTKKKINKTYNKTYNNTHNNKIIKILSIVKNYYENQKDRIHVNAYERAIYQIKHWDKPITKGNELSSLVGIGKGMIEKIDTIIETGTLPIIKEKGLYISNNKTKKNKLVKANNNINHILGFGNKLLSELKTKHHARTINDIRKIVSEGKVKLTHMQELGLKHYEDLSLPIPRNEIKEIGNKIKSIIEKSNKFLTCFIAGSYPSGTKETSKDIDLLIVVKDDVTHNLGMYRDILKNIENVMSLETISLGNETFLGLVKNNSKNSSHKWRHLDIRITLIDNLPYAWLYYTGGKIFNKLIRERLKKKGYKLNEYGLYVSKTNSRIDLDNKELDKYNINKDGMLNINEKQMMQYVENVEKKIFEIADLEYKSVQERY